MKKLIMIFAVLASISFANDDKNYEVLKVEGDSITVKNLITEEISVIQKTQALNLGINLQSGTLTLGESFADAMMPGSSQGSDTPREVPIVLPPADVTTETVTAAYGAK